MSDGPASDVLVAGTLHVYVAFDWGDELDLERARQLVPAEVHDLPRRRRTPPSIAYRPPPLRFRLAPVALGLAVGDNQPAEAEATVFDFAAVSVAFHQPFRLPLGGLSTWPVAGRSGAGPCGRPHGCRPPARRGSCPPFATRNGATS